MFGHQDYTDTDNDQGHQQDIDNSIQEFNSSSAPADNPNPSPVVDDQPTAVSQPDPAVSSSNDPYVVNLPDESTNQIVDLVDLKAKALDELYPIIHKLDLSAEENFKTLMMMIQATDNKELISQAYQAAEKIEDESSRAKALLDIVNEINYFTNHPSIDQ